MPIVIIMITNLKIDFTEEDKFYISYFSTNY